MSDPTLSTFNAAPSMLGYLYQVRVALLWAIRQSRVGDFTVSVETLDDVSFEVDGDPVAVLQTKHSMRAASGLGDLSSDLWKTLRIWMVGRSSGSIGRIKGLLDMRKTRWWGAAADRVVERWADLEKASLPVPMWYR